MKTKNAIAYFLGSLIIIVFVTLPLFQKFLKSQNDLRNKKQEFLQEEKHIENLKKAEKDLERYMPTLEMIDKAVSDDPAVASLIYYLEKSSQNHGMFLEDVSSFSVEESEIFSGLRETSLSFSVSGNYSDFKRFINSIENSVKVIKTEEFLINLDSEQKKISFKVNIKTYSY
jgi:Tfp pilus assembly protein PilO